MNVWNFFFVFIFVALVVCAASVSCPPPARWIGIKLAEFVIWVRGF